MPKRVPGSSTNLWKFTLWGGESGGWGAGGTFFAAGIGNPFFSSDTAASLRAMEIKADVLLKGTKVEGVYNADPVLFKDAVKYDEITYMEILRQGLKVMDLTAVSLCKDNNLPLIIFNMN